MAAIKLGSERFGDLAHRMASQLRILASGIEAKFRGYYT